MGGQRKLSDIRIRAAKPLEKPFKLSDGDGLFLLVAPTGAKLWRLAYRFAGKQKTLALGQYGADGADLTLREARERADEARKLLKDGRDPGLEKKLRKLAGANAAANTFSLVADEFLEKIEREGQAASTLEKTRWLLDLARPSIGSRPVGDIRPAEVLAVLKAVERRGRLESARRLRSTLGRVFRYAVATARADSDPAAPLVGALTAPTVTSRAAITDPKEFGALLRAIDDYEGTPETIAALKLLALLFPRPGELRHASWSEFDLGAAVWTIPAARTKMRREHRVPLPPQAVEILRGLYDLTGSGTLLIPSARSRLRPMSDNTLNGALRRMGFTKEQATSHGFRASASTMLNESGRFSPDVIEAALAHKDPDPVRAAYNRAQHWEARQELMRWWADRVDVMRRGAEVLPISIGAA